MESSLPEENKDLIARYTENLSLIRTNDNGDLLCISLRKFVTDILDQKHRPLTDTDLYVLHCVEQFHIYKCDVKEGKDFKDFYKRLILMLDALLVRQK